MVYPKYEVYRENVEIPNEVLINQNLNFIQKYIYSIILEDCNTLGYCNATNEYFQKLLQTTECSVMKGIVKLVELGLIVIRYKIKANYYNKRVIYLSKDGHTNDDIEIYKAEPLKIKVNNIKFNRAPIKNALWNILVEEHNKNGVVLFTNTYFMQQLNVCKKTVKLILQDLKMKGLVRIALENNNKRKIYLNKEFIND